MFSYLFGCAFDRWNLSLITGEDEVPALTDPFGELPRIPRGMLAERSDFAEILVEQGGEPGDSSLSERIKGVVHRLGQLHDEDVELQLCQTLNVRSLHAYISKPTGFFDDHLKRYAKSKRAAPIYWPISGESGTYTLWLYYPRLTDQTLYKAVNDFVDPKLKETGRQLANLRAINDRSSAQEKELAKLTELKAELDGFKADLLEIATFWKPDLNDGVQITAAPLWKFFRLTKWRNRLKKTWEELGAGKYDWAHLALSIWPERVVKDECTTERSIAIAHGLEEQMWHEVEVRKVSKSGQVTTKMEWQPKDLTDAELDAIVAEVKARK
jgi:hypothetical protein